MRRDTLPEFERGEYAGQDAILRHIAGMDETNNSAVAQVIRHSEPFKTRAEILRQVAEWLAVASFQTGYEYDPEAARACQHELGILQARANKYAGEKEE